MYSAVATIATLFAAWVLPAARVTGLTLIVGGGLAYSVSRIGVARAEEQFVAGRAAVSAAVMHTHGAADLIMWQAEQRALSGVDEVGEAASRAASGQQLLSRRRVRWQSAQPGSASSPSPGWVGRRWPTAGCPRPCSRCSSCFPSLSWR